jgi:PTH1 family peptidyl-tRNA hydrolase
VKLLVGLGNPGSEYERSRHNVGFMVADRVARRLRAEFASRKFGAEIAEGQTGGERVLVLKPQTFMNHSGEPVGAAARFYKVPPADVVVIHDDLELDPFRVQVKLGGGHGGNNGVKSVNAHLGTPEYVRVRVGVGRPPHPSQSAGWVLARFPKGFEGPLEECLEAAADAALAVVEGGVVKAMNEFNRRKQPA